MLNSISLTEKQINRFWSKVDRKGDDECWEWQRATNDRGYGKVGLINKTFKSHRVAYMLACGNIPDGLEVCHSCDNPPCCNPRHLFLGTHAANQNDMKIKGRANGGGPAGERNGNAKLSDANIGEIRSLLTSGSSPSQIAKQFGISETHVHRIRKGKQRK